VPDRDPAPESGGGAPPAGPEALLRELEGLGIEHRTVEHPPVFTVAEARALRGRLPGAHVKNLFLRNKQGRMWLVTCFEDRAIDLKRLGERIGAGRLSFASAERLATHLGVIPGAVTPFALVNDRAHAVTFVLERALLDHDPINLHPLDNGRTTAVSPMGLLRFLEWTGHEPVLLDLGGE